MSAIIACPYTAGGCPLFNTQLDLDVPRCTGGCSPPVEPTSPPAHSAIVHESVPISTLSLPSLPALPSAQGPFIDYSFPSDLLDLSSYTTGRPTTPLSVRDANAASPRRTDALKRNLVDIEELLTAKRPYNNLGPTQTFPPAEASTALHSDDSATPFVSKLVYLLGHSEDREYIRWDVTGSSIVLAHTKPETLEVLAKYFRHTTIASFVRQLNIYGFKRLSTTQLLDALGPNTTLSAADYCAFSHPDFYRSTPERHCYLAGLKPAASKEKGAKSVLGGRRKKTVKRMARDEDSN